MRAALHGHRTPVAAGALAAPAGDADLPIANLASRSQEMITEVDMRREHALPIRTMLSVLVFGNSDARAAGRLDLATFRAAALQQHNVYRGKHGVPPSS